MIGGYTIPYAPYIMLLIKKTLKNHDFSQEIVESHYYKKIYDKKVKPPPYPASGSFMRDARTSGARPSGARTSGAHRQAATPSIAPKIKKLNWFQKHILCMNVDIRKSQYDAYR